jgi:hypothetical protein
MATAEEFAQVISFLEAGTGAPRTPTERVKVYAQMLGHFPPEVLRAAAVRVLEEHRYPTLPPVADILRHVRDLLTDAPWAHQAWAAVRGFMLRWSCWLLDGPPTHPKSRAKMDAELAALPPLALAAARAIGWGTLLESPAAVAFAQFERTYKSVADQAEVRSAELQPALPKSATRAALEVIAAGIGLPGGA